VWSVQRIPTAVNFGFLDRGCHFLEIAPHNPCEAEWTPFQAHYFSENLVAPGIEPGTSKSVARNCDHWTTEAVSKPTFTFENKENRLKMIHQRVKQEYPTSPIALICRCIYIYIYIYIDHFIIYCRLKPNFG
jgi:hypothetical protein